MRHFPEDLVQRAYEAIKPTLSEFTDAEAFFDSSFKHLRAFALTQLNQKGATPTQVVTDIRNEIIRLYDVSEKSEENVLRTGGPPLSSAEAEAFARLLEFLVPPLIQKGVEDFRRSATILKKRFFPREATLLALRKLRKPLPWEFAILQSLLMNPALLIVSDSSIISETMRVVGRTRTAEYLRKARTNLEEFIHERKNCCIVEAFLHAEQNVPIPELPQHGRHAPTAERQEAFKDEFLGDLWHFYWKLTVKPVEPNVVSKNGRAEDENIGDIFLFNHQWPWEFPEPGKMTWFYGSRGSGKTLVLRKLAMKHKVLHFNLNKQDLTYAPLVPESEPSVVVVDDLHYCLLYASIGEHRKVAEAWILKTIRNAIRLAKEHNAHLILVSDSPLEETLQLFQELREPAANLLREMMSYESRRRFVTDEHGIDCLDAELGRPCINIRRFRVKRSDSDDKKQQIFTEADLIAPLRILRFFFSHVQPQDVVRIAGPGSRYGVNDDGNVFVSVSTWGANNVASRMFSFFRHNVQKAPWMESGVDFLATGDVRDLRTMELFEQTP